MPLNDDVLGAPLSELGLSVRAVNILLNNGFSTVRDVVARTERELFWQLPGLGRGTLIEIKAKLGARGLALRPGGAPRYKWKRRGDARATAGRPVGGE